MDKNSRKFLKVLALLLCEANNIGGMKSSASGNGNLQLITQNTKNINKANKENTNWIKQNPIKSLLIGLFGVAGLVLGEEIIRHKFFANSNEPTFDEKNVISDNDEILKIIEDLKKKAPEIQKASKNQDYSKFKTTWEGLSYLLGEDATKFVEENYPEWKERLSKNSYKNWQYYYGYESFALMSMAFTLRLAALKKYQHDDIKNNELLLGENLPNFTLKPCNNDGNIRKKRLEKVIVEDNDILRSAHKFLLNHPGLNVKIGFLNAGDPYEPNGFLPNHGSALEECLSMNTTLVRDLSGKEFRKDQGKQGFYTTRQNFPPVCDGDTSPTIEDVRERQIGSGRSFYHQRGIMSRNVRLIRNLGDCNKNDYKHDSSFPFEFPNKHFDEFNPPKDGLGAIKFCILSIAGLEDRSKTVLEKFGDEFINANDTKSPTVHQIWEKITKTQCEFVLKAFINEGVKIPFLCAFGAGCFGGKASMVAKCFKELLIDEGYVDHFDYVVFPIGYNENNYKAFKNAFGKK